MISDESGVKLFDRKFVASNLQSLLRCPKCKNDFTSTAGKTHEVRHRPFLLPCGHSLCEDCILKNRKNLKCAICFNSAPSTINAKDPNSKYGVCVRDFYELNYHALGEVASLFYFRRFTQDSVNKSMIITADDDIIIEPKCSECGHNMSNLGDCAQCNACYCKRCFDTVHRHSRVLQAHQFKLQQQNDRKLNSQSIRVGNEIFEMPYKKVCQIHKAPENIYCGSCRGTKCEKCIKLHHSSHKGIRPIYKMNMRLIDEIPTSLGLIESALGNIKNSQLVVKNTKKILGDYAIETLTKISKHFGHLHGLLQMAELQVIEKLRESSLSPQIKLNEAMNNLNGYETVLKTLREFYETESNFGVPRNVWLKELMGLTERHLDKMPANVQVTNLDKNPYSFDIAVSSGQTMTALLGKNFRCSFIDPQIKVRFQSVFEMNSPISSICEDPKNDSSFFKFSSSEKENAKQSQHKKLNKKSFRQSKNQLNYLAPSQPGQSPDLCPLTAQLKANYNKKMKRASTKDVGKRNNISISNTSSSTEGARMPNNNIRREIECMRTTFSDIDISNSNNNHSNNNNRMWFNSDIMLKVRAINSPEDFFVQGIHAAQRIEREIEAFCQTSDCRQPEKIVLGQNYIIYHSEGNRYHRALVSEKLQEKDLYQVILPDIGMQYQMHAKNFRELPRKLTLIPFAAVNCKLKHLMPRNGGPEWDAEATKFFKQLVQNNSVYVTMGRPTGPNNIYEVELMVTNYNTNISVRESFLYTGLARACYGNAYAANAVKPKPLVALQGQRLPMYQAVFGDAFMAQILHLDTPHEFYVMRHDLESKRYEMQTTLQSVMNRLHLSQLENIYLGRLHLACVLQTENQWHRARIEQMLPEGFVVVRLVDIGTVQKVSWDHLFILPSKFWHTELAIKCRLADVETLAEHGYLWTPDAIKSFTQLTSNPKLHMEIVGTREDFVHVALNVIRPCGDMISVGAQMVMQNHCKSTGDTSRLLALSTASRLSRLDDDTRKFIKKQTKRNSNLSLAEGDTYSQMNRNRNKRVPIKILYVKQPDEFYVTLPQFIPAIESLKKLVQKVAAEMHEKCLPRCEWSVGDMCYVHFQAQCDEEMMWHRGIIVKVIFSDSESPKYRIRLRDLGQLASDIPASQLTTIDEAHMLISDSALRCHLYGIHPKSGRWTSQNIDSFRDHLQAYNGLEVSSYGRDENSLAVVLWGSRTEIPGPFAPERVKYSSINDMLVLSKIAFKDENKSSVRSDINSNEEAESSCSITLQSCQENIDDGMQASNLVASKESLSQSMVSLSLTQHNDEMPPLKLLTDLNMSSITTGETSAPLAWTMPRECTKSIFTALPTYVNYGCQAYLTFANDKPFLEQMRNTLEKHFKPMINRLGGVHHYVVGQPVLVTYHLDNLLYRGIVRSLANLQGEYNVYFIDYGNDELVKSAEMLPYAPFPQLKAMCWLVDIHGARTVSKKYTIVEMDTVHKQIVMKLCSVRVIDVKGPNGIPSCQIKVDDLDIGEMISKMGESIPLENNLLDSFKVFDELLHFGEPVKELQPDDDSTIKPPPPKKALVEEINLSDSDTDIDCEQEALEMSMAQKLFGMYSYRKKQKNDANFFEDLEPESEENDSIPLQNSHENKDDCGDLPTGLNISLSFDNNKTDDLEPHSSAVLKQLRRRIELRRKDMMNKVDFIPVDTSTVFSYDAEICFQPQSLPIGVNQFLCTVDSVVSATELQISPCLTEFTKIDINLCQETSAVIKKAAPLHPEVDTLCLAQYAKDKQWYRATITELHPATQRATVLYIDFHDTETVPYSSLKVMPTQLFTYPLRSFRVKLHKVKLNQSFSDQTVRQALHACLCAHPFVFARVFHPSTYHDELRKGHRLLEVELYENEHKQKVLYQPLIENWMYV
ncbi:uncharacterized protein qin [Drosophila tropicalis]|uniref:uncharacterized protein qin n=1 Tax=Drosophila tropicalis TaxID=46794 RepID=UPI0035ABEC09